MSTADGGRLMPPGSQYYPWPSITSGQPNNGVGDNYGDVTSSSISATITPVFRWVPGSDPAAPPTMLYAKITTDAFAGDGNEIMTCLADDGFGDVTDPNNYSYDGLYPDVASVGVHLEQKDPQGQTLVKLPPQDVSADGGRATDYRNISTQVDYLAEPDNRAVTISSSIDPTYHKSTTNFDSNGVALGDPDTPTSDGTTKANSVKPAANDDLDSGDLDEQITYTAYPIGSWAADSSYLWHLTQGEPTITSSVSGGTFTMPGDPPYTYSATYNLSDIGNDQKPEHVYIHLTDAGDGANATNNYYIQWHDPVENWAKLGSSTELAPKLFGTSDNSQPANGFVNIKIAPDEVDWSVAEHAGGGIVTTAAAVLAIAQPETSPVVIGIMTAAGYTLSLAAPPDPTLYTPQGTESQFEADVDTENNIASGNTTGIFRRRL